jgi:hypothetical protein
METLITALIVIGLQLLLWTGLLICMAGTGVLWKHCTQPHQHSPNDRRKTCDRDQVAWL